MDVLRMDPRLKGEKIVGGDDNTQRHVQRNQHKKKFSFITLTCSEYYLLNICLTIDQLVSGWVHLMKFKVIL